MELVERALRETMWTENIQQSKWLNTNSHDSINSCPPDSGFFFQTKTLVSIYKTVNWLSRSTKLVKQYTYPSRYAASVIPYEILSIVLSYSSLHFFDYLYAWRKWEEHLEECIMESTMWVFWAILLKRCLNYPFPWQFHVSWEKACPKFGFAWACVVSS